MPIHTPSFSRLTIAVMTACGLAAACSDKPLPPPPAKSAAPKSTAAPKVNPTASSSAKPQTSVVVPPSDPTGPSRWADFGGPFPKPTVATGDRAWCAIPVSGGWEALKLSVLEVAGVDDVNVRAKVGEVETYVPAAFVSRVEPARALEKGAPVIASAEGTRVFARVVTPGDKATTIRYRFAGTESEKELDNTLIIALDGTLKYGALVSFDGRRELDKSARWRLGTFVSAQEDRTWLLDAGGKPVRVASASVRPIPAQTPRVGDRVVVARQGDFVPATLKSVVEGGLQYEVTTEDGNDFVASFEAVAPPIP